MSEEPKKLEEKFEEYYKDEDRVSVNNQFKDLAQIAEDHYLGIYDKFRIEQSLSYQRGTHELRKALEGKK